MSTHCTLLRSVRTVNENHALRDSCIEQTLRPEKALILLFSNCTLVELFLALNSGDISSEAKDVIKYKLNCKNKNSHL